jgi:hypothetical protein
MTGRPLSAWEDLGGRRPDNALARPAPIGERNRPARRSRSARAGLEPPPQPGRRAGPIETARLISSARTAIAAARTAKENSP